MTILMMVITMMITAMIKVIKMMCGMTSYDTGYINASAEGVNINTVWDLVRDGEGRLRINNITCDAEISKMKAQFSGTLGYEACHLFHPPSSPPTSLPTQQFVCGSSSSCRKLYHLLAGFLTSGMRFALNKKVSLSLCCLCHLSVSQCHGPACLSHLDPFRSVSVFLGAIYT